MERSIKVTGKGHVALTPDTIRINITQSEVKRTYDMAVKDSSENKGMLNAGLINLGFEKSQLKTKSFNIHVEHESVRDKNGNWRNEFRGYRYTHRMVLEIPADNKILGKVLYLLAHYPGKPSFDFVYTVSDPEKAKNELLERAIADSRQKAEVMTKAAGVTLGMVRTIDYSWGEIDFALRPVQDLCMMEAKACPSEVGGSYDMDIDAEDIEAEDTVTVIWEIM